METLFQRPNILLILCDDMGYSDIGCYGSEIHTPHIDRLAREGIRLSHGYNAARCCPTRASLLTGLYPHQAGMGGMVKGTGTGPYQGFLNDQCVTIAEVLRESGYSTAMSGKWHVGEDEAHWPMKRGFESYYGLISGAMNYFDISKTKAPGVVRRFARDDRTHTPGHEGFYITDAITDNAIRMLQDACRKERPFFQYVAYTAPHWPLHALPEDIERYRGTYRKGWDTLREERYARLLQMGMLDSRWKLSPRDKEAQPWTEIPNPMEMDLKMAVYAGQIDRMDQGIGRILDELDNQDKADNTLVLFLSDNGGCHEGGPWGFDRRKNGLPPGGVDSYMSYGLSWANASNTPFRLYKQYIHEGGISTPWIFRWPKRIKAPGSIDHQVCHIIDIMATCCDLACATYPEEFQGRKILPLEGKTLRPILEGKRRDPHEALFWEHFGNQGIRKGDWKLVSVKNENWELYNLEEDRTEQNNLILKYPQKASELRDCHTRWTERVGV